MFQHRCAHHEERRFVLHHQHGLTAAPWDYLLLSPLGRDGFLARVAGKIDFKGRTMFRFAVDVDESVILLDNAIHRREPQAGSLANTLAREKRLENLVEDLLVHAAAIV